MAPEAKDILRAREKLRLLKSPIIGTDNGSASSHTATVSPDGDTIPILNDMGDRVGPVANTPEFQKHDEASILELFFDLFFAANYTVFSQTQSVTSSQRFTAFIGYFCILWMTWLLVGLYDVRFVTDSIFERIARGVHLGVLVGFAVVAPDFDPSDQNLRTMKTMSLILMASRLCLAVEYGSILWHTRKFKNARLPFFLQVAINVSAAAVYLGITFRFRHENSHVFIAWYLMSILEVVLTILISNLWAVLSFTKTHLMKRMSLLTIIILGDGIVIMAQNVVTIVKTPDAWNTLTIGIVTAATATIYFVFMIYFDWMKRNYLPAWRQQAWTLLHFPFHLALVLFMQGFTQFIIWSKIIDVLNNLSFDSIMNSLDATAEATSLEIQENLYNITTEYFALYPPKYYDTWESVNYALTNVTDISDSFWPQIIRWIETQADADLPSADDATLYLQIMTALSSSMSNALYENFGIDLYKELLDENPNVDINGGGFQNTVNEETWNRYMLVFAYGYIAAGATLLLMTLLTIVSRITPWKPWHLIRTIINFVLAIALGLVSLLYYQPARADKYLFSPWVLPTITMVWIIILVLTHIRNPPPLFFQQSAAAMHSQQHKYDQVAVPMHDRFSAHTKPVGSVEAWDMGMHRRLPSEASESYFGQASVVGASYSPPTQQQPSVAGATYSPYGERQQSVVGATYSPYEEQQANYMPTAYGAHASPQETAYDSYQHPTEFRHG